MLTNNKGGRVKRAQVALVVFALLVGQAQADLIFGGDFEIYKTGTAYTVTGELDDPGPFTSYVQGVGDGVNVAGNGVVNYSDGTSSTNEPVDLPGWVVVPGKGNPDTGRNGVGGTEGLNIFASWGGQQRVESTAALGTVEAGKVYTISAMVDGGAGSPIEGDLAFHLMADGTNQLAPVAPLAPLTGGLGFQAISQTYDTTSTAGHIGEALSIILGVEDTNANGNRMIWDNVSLTVDTSTPGTSGTLLYGK